MNLLTDKRIFVTGMSSSLVSTGAMHFMAHDVTDGRLLYFKWVGNNAASFVYIVQENLEVDSIFPSTVFAGQQTHTHSNGENLEAYTVGGVKNLHNQVDYNDYYFGVVITTIETDTCLTTGSAIDNDITFTAVNPVVSAKLFESSLTVLNTETDVQCEIQNDV